VNFSCGDIPVSIRFLPENCENCSDPFWRRAARLEDCDDRVKQSAGPVRNVMRVIKYWSYTELGFRAGRPTPLALSLVVQSVAKRYGLGSAESHTSDLIHAVFEQLADPKSIIIGNTPSPFHSGSCFTPSLSLGVL